MFDDHAHEPDTDSREDQRDFTRPSRTGYRIVRAHLDRRRHRLLDELAADCGVQPEQLASIWLRERIDQHTGAKALARAVDELADIRALLAGAADPGHPQRAVRGGRPGHAATARGAHRRRADKPRESLHNEIVSVLAQQGRPMTAAEIADAIRERGQYKAPRSGNPISGAHVSRRIANPYYRSLFERHGRQVRLAADADR